MTQEDAAEFSRAVNLAQTNKPIAHAILKGLASRYPDNTLVVLWLAFTSPDLIEAERAVRLAESQNPSDQNVVAARQWLQEEKLKAPATPPTPARTAAYTVPVLPPVPAVDFSPAPVATTAPEPAATQSDPGYKVINHGPSSEFKRPSEILNIGPETQTKTTGNGWVNPAQPDMPTLRDELVKGKRNRERKPISTLTILAGVLGVLVLALIFCGVYFFILNPSTLSDTPFDKAGLPVFSDLEKLELTQSMKDQLASGYANPQLSKNGVKVNQVEFYKIKTTSSASDFVNFYKAELDKAGWNIQSVPISTVSPQPFLLGIKSHSYILLGAVVPGKGNGSEPNLSAQLAPNQLIAFAILFEQDTPNS